MKLPFAFPGMSRLSRGAAVTALAASLLIVGVNVGTASATTPWPAPTGLQVDSQGDVTWNPVSGAWSYFVYELDADGNYMTAYDVDGTTFHADSGARTFEVYAIGGGTSGYASWATEPLTVDPTDFTQVNHPGAYLYWTVPHLGSELQVVDYRILDNGNPYATTMGTSVFNGKELEYSIPNAQSGHKYTVSVAIKYAVTQWVSGETVTEPTGYTYVAPPTGLWLGSVCGYSDLNWQPVPGAVGYNVYQGNVEVGSTNSGSYYGLTEWMGNSLLGNDAWTVRAVSPDGIVSLDSNSVSTAIDEGC